MEMQGRPPAIADHPPAHSQYSHSTSATTTSSTTANNPNGTSTSSSVAYGPAPSSDSTVASAAAIFPDLPRKRPAAPRKKKPDETSDPGAEKTKKPRKPRDPNKPSARKKQKLDETSSTSSNDAAATIKVAMPVPIPNPSLTASNSPNHITPDASSLTSPKVGTQQNGRPTSNGAAPIFSIPEAPKPKPTTSGPYYDPIRGSSMTPAARLSSPAASAMRQSPSISSLMNPSEPANRAASAVATTSTLNGHSKHDNGDPLPVLTSSLNTAALSQPQPSAAAIKPDPTANTGPSFVTASTADLKNTSNAKLKEIVPKEPSPQESRGKEPSPIMGLGSGLFSNSLFGAGPKEPKTYAEVPNQCIVIEVPMSSETGHCYVNFMAEVEKKYGFDVAHPRLAEHRRRMKQIAAAGAAIESNPGSEDEMADASDVDSNADMGGVDDESAADGSKKRSTAKGKRGDAYDIDDDFIDDTEMIWEEQALASKDGYFVWAGPLVPAGDKASTDRADGASKRGRGGRGRGSGRGGASARGESTRGKTSTRGGRGGAGTGRKRATKTADVKAEPSTATKASTPAPTTLTGN